MVLYGPIRPKSSLPASSPCWICAELVTTETSTVTPSGAKRCQNSGAEAWLRAYTQVRIVRPAPAGAAPEPHPANVTAAPAAVSPRNPRRDNSGMYHSSAQCSGGAARGHATATACPATVERKCQRGDIVADGVPVPDRPGIRINAGPPER